MEMLFNSGVYQLEKQFADFKAFMLYDLFWGDLLIVKKNGDDKVAFRGHVDEQQLTGFTFSWATLKALRVSDEFPVTDELREWADSARAVLKDHVERYTAPVL
jgi:hypothetical protein